MLYYDPNFHTVVTIPIDVGVQSGTPALGGIVRYELQLTEEGVTVEVCVRVGSVIVYASYSIPNPNEAIYDFRFEIVSMEEPLCADVFVPPETDTDSGITKRQAIEEIDSTLFVALVGAAEQNEFFLNVSQGDNTG